MTFDLLLPTEDFKYIYAVVATLCVFFRSATMPLSPWRDTGRSRQGYDVAIMLAIFFTIYFGLRPQSGIPMGDTQGYVGVYKYHMAHVTEINREHVWNHIEMFMARNAFAPEAWLTVVAAIYMFANLAGSRRLFGAHVLTAYIFFLTFFLYYQGGMNGIRNAAGYSLVFLGLALYYKPSKHTYWWVLLMFLLGYGCHSSVVITIAAFIASKYMVRNPKWAIAIWLVTIALSLTMGNTLATFVTETSDFTDDARALNYLNSGKDAADMAKSFSHVGFRWDFLIFSTLPIALGYFAHRRFPRDTYFRILLNTYILANAFWIVFMYAKFTNRFAMLSWCIYPYVLAYPLLKYKLWSPQTQRVITNLLLWVNLLFALYMNMN